MRKNRLPRAVRVRPQMDPAVFFFSASFLLGGIAGYFSCCGMGIDAELQTYLVLRRLGYSRFCFERCRRLLPGALHGVSMSVIPPCVLLALRRFSV